MTQQEALRIWEMKQSRDYVVTWQADDLAESVDPQIAEWEEEAGRLLKEMQDLPPTEASALSLQWDALVDRIEARIVEIAGLPPEELRR